MNSCLPAVLNVLAASVALAARFLDDYRFDLAGRSPKYSGLFVVYAGMALAVWAPLYVRAGVLGMVKPRGEVLLVDGPYRLVRHPMYLGMIIALVCVAVMARSWFGLIAAVLLFLPSELHRARPEERALKEKFGPRWEDYAGRTGLFLPRRRRR